MSLRIFHIVFISVSVALMLYLAVWGGHEFMVARSSRGITLLVVGLAGSTALIWYGKRAFHKLKELP